MEIQVTDLFAKIGVLTMENELLKARIKELEEAKQDVKPDEPDK
jgi:hypothetical protein